MRKSMNELPRAGLSYTCIHHCSHCAETEERQEQMLTNNCLLVAQVYRCWVEVWTMSNPLIIAAFVLTPRWPGNGGPVVNQFWNLHSPAHFSVGRKRSEWVIASGSQLRSVMWAADHGEAPGADDPDPGGWAQCPGPHCPQASGISLWTVCRHTESLQGEESSGEICIGI